MSFSPWTALRVIFPMDSSTRHFTHGQLCVSFSPWTALSVIFPMDSSTCHSPHGQLYVTFSPWTALRVILPMDSSTCHFPHGQLYVSFSHGQLYVSFSPFSSLYSVTVTSTEGFRQRIGNDTYIASTAVHREVLYRYKYTNKSLLIKYFFLCADYQQGQTSLSKFCMTNLH